MMLTVNLVRTARFSPLSSVLTQLARARHRIPFDERPRSKRTVVNRPQQMSADSKEILYDAMDGREALQMRGRLEAPHLTLALSGRLM